MKSALLAAAGALALCACANMNDDSSTVATQDDYASQDAQSASETASVEADADMTTADSGVAAGAAASPSVIALSPQEFAREGIQLAMLTVEASKLAAAQATDPEVKTFATQAQTDHQAIVDRLKTAYPEEAAATLDTERNQMIADLSADTAEFDEEYLDLLEDSHQQAIALYRNLADADGTTGEEPMAEGDADVEEATMIAQETLPRLEAHLTEIQRLDAKTDDVDDMMETDDTQ